MLHSLLFLTALIGCLALGAAALSDLVRFTIPNPLALLLAVTAIAMLGLRQVGLHGWLWHLGLALVVLAVGALLVAVKAWGAGDAKLLAAAALWAGPNGMAELVLWTVLAGGALALLLLFFRRVIQGRSLKVLQSGQAVPYGLAIAVGGVHAILRHGFI